MTTYLCYTVATVRTGYRYQVEAASPEEAERTMRAHLRGEDTGDKVEEDSFYTGETEGLAEEYDPAVGPEESSPHAENAIRR